MIKNELPKTPAQAWRDLAPDEKAYSIGQALRILWELAKPVLAWTAFILAVGVWAVTKVVLNGVLPRK